MGCKSNQFEGSIIKENLNKNGLQEVKNIEEADIYILNSCSVTHKSDNEAMYLLRNAKHKNANIINIITGCVAQIEKEKLFEHDFVDFVVGNDEKLNLFDILSNGLKCSASDIMKLKYFNKVVLEDMTKTRASLKIQDGCDNRCSYCIIPYARGKSRSADIDFIIEQINNFSKHGFKEVVLTGIHIGQWGKDFGMELLDLLKQIESRTTIERFRLGSLNPLEITDEMLEFLQKSDKFCPHFHLSLQSGCDSVLKRMNRHYTAEQFAQSVKLLRKYFPDAAITTDVIVGFPQESEEEFQKTYDFVEKVGFSQLHIFKYSQREGTAAVKLYKDVLFAIKQSRLERLEKLNEKLKEKFLSDNNAGEVLFEEKDGKFYVGYTKNYIRCFVESKKSLTNQIHSVKFEEKYKDGMLAKLILKK